MEINYKKLYEEKDYECNHLNIKNMSLKESSDFWKHLFWIVLFVCAFNVIFGSNSNSLEDNPDCDPTAYYPC